MERETGFEPATSTLARSHSTTELFPLAGTLMIPSRRLVNQPALPDSRPVRPQRRRILDRPLGLWYDAVFAVLQHPHSIGAVAKW